MIPRYIVVKHETEELYLICDTHRDNVIVAVAPSKEAADAKAEELNAAYGGD